MKNIIILTTFLLFTTLSNGSIAINTVETDMPVPEIIACESKRTCEMTTLNMLDSME